MELVLTVAGSIFLCLLIWLGMRAATLQERARCSAIVAGRICGGHWPKRDIAVRLGDPCGYCDRVAECLDYIEKGELPY